MGTFDHLDAVLADGAKIELTNTTREKLIRAKIKWPGKGGRISLGFGFGLEWAMKNLEAFVADFPESSTTPRKKPPQFRNGEQVDITDGVPSEDYVREGRE